MGGFAESLEGFNQAMRRRYAAARGEPEPEPEPEPKSIAELEARAEAEHAAALEARLLSMTAAHKLSGAAGPPWEPRFETGVAEMLAQQKRQCGNALQAIGLTVAYCVRQGWLTEEQAATLNCHIAMPEELRQARAREYENRRNWETQFSSVLDAVRKNARNGTAGAAAVQTALAMWNHNAQNRRYDPESFARWQSELRAAKLL